MLTPKAKLWLKLKKSDISVIGEGRARLLRAVQNKGSITKAAQGMNMSYRHAWGIIKSINETIGKDVVMTTRGGASGGGAKLTKVGQQVLEQYEDNAAEIQKLLKYGPRPALAVDGVIFDKDGNLILIRRKNIPFKGKLALPGGFVENNETTEDAVMREVKEELGIQTRIKGLIGVYSDPTRDPRSHVISVVYELEPLSDKFKAGDDAQSYERIAKNKLDGQIELAFDHGKIISEILSKK